MVDTVFPPPRVLRKLYKLIKEDFAKYLQANYADTPRDIGKGLETEVVKILENGSTKYNYRVHLTHQESRIGFSGLLHQFDAGIEDRDDTLRQCLFEVKYRGEETNVEQEDIMKFHHATFEYFLKLLTDQKWRNCNIFRCFITNEEVNDGYRQFFYTWGIALIDPTLRPLCCLPEIFNTFKDNYGETDHLLDLIKRSEKLIEQAYFSLASLVPPDQEFGNILYLDKLNPAVDSASILDEHKSLDNEVNVLQQKFSRGRYK